MNTTRIRIGRRLTAAALTAFTLVWATGCGSGTSELSGTYQSKLGPGQTLSLKFLGNNEMQATMTEDGRDESYKTSYITSGDKIIMNIPESERQSGGPTSMEIRRNGAALEMTMEGMTMRFEKI
jgi:hypothetical protein